jgi:excisionase family DNA binding protein
VSQTIKIDEAVRRTSLSKHTLYRAVKAGKLRATRPTGPGGPLLIWEDSLQEWLEAGTVRPAGRPRVDLPPAVGPRVRVVAGSVASLDAIERRGAA